MSVFICNDEIKALLTQYIAHQELPNVTRYIVNILTLFGVGLLVFMANFVASDREFKYVSQMLFDTYDDNQ